MAAATDHIDHVRTQLPYALVAAAFATAGFLLLGLLI
jgi:Na+/H+ antiporter NhaC